MASTILHRNAPPGDLWHACHGLYRLLLDVTGLPSQEYAPEVAAETMLPNGKAIAPIEAARCLLDPFRTQAFACGVADAIAQRRRVEPSRPVRVLYAGCGPFATLLLPAFTLFTPDELRCTLIDVHQPSLDAVRMAISRLGLEDFIDAVVKADATAYQIPADSSPDVLVIECLLRGLSSEPQVGITWNLVSQARTDVVLVPAEIRLHAVHAADFARRTGPTQPLPRVHDDPIFVLSRDSVASWGAFDPTAAALPARPVVIRRSVSSPELLALATTIRTYGDLELDDYATGLTMPVPLEHPASLPAGTRLDLRYSLTKPGVEVIG